MFASAGKVRRWFCFMGSAIPAICGRRWPLFLSAIMRGKGIADHIADIVGDEIRTLDVQLIKNMRDIGGLGFLVVAAGRMRGEAHAA